MAILNYETDIAVSGIDFQDIKFEFDMPDTSGAPDTFKVLVGENSGYLDMSIADAFELEGDIVSGVQQTIRVNANEFIEENFGYLVGYSLYDREFYWKYNLYEQDILNYSSDMRKADTMHSDGYLMKEVYSLHSNKLTALEMAKDMPEYNRISNKIKRKIAALKSSKKYISEVNLIHAANKEE